MKTLDHFFKRNSNQSLDLDPFDRERQQKIELLKSNYRNFPIKHTKMLSKQQISNFSIQPSPLPEQKIPSQVQSYVQNKLTVKSSHAVNKMLKMQMMLQKQKECNNSLKTNTPTTSHKNLFQLQSKEGQTTKHTQKQLKQWLSNKKKESKMKKVKSMKSELHKNNQCSNNFVINKKKRKSNEHKQTQEKFSIFNPENNSNRFLTTSNFYSPLPCSKQQSNSTDLSLNKLLNKNSQSVNCMNANSHKPKLINQYYEKMIKTHQKFFQKVGQKDDINSSNKKQLNFKQFYGKDEKQFVPLRGQKKKQILIKENNKLLVFRQLNKSTKNGKSLNKLPKQKNLQTLIINQLSELRKKRNSIGSCNSSQQNYNQHYHKQKQEQQKSKISQQNDQKTFVNSKGDDMQDFQNDQQPQQNTIANHSLNTSLNRQKQVLKQNIKKESLIRKNSLFLLNYLRQKQRSNQKNKNEEGPHIGHLNNVVIAGNLSPKKSSSFKKLPKQQVLNGNNTKKHIQNLKKQQKQRAVFNSMKIQPW